MLLTHATLATMTGGYGLIADAAVAIAGDHIAWAGPMAEIPDEHRARPRHASKGGSSPPA
jgi:imidazolonepropionase